MAVIMAIIYWRRQRGSASYSAVSPSGEMQRGRTAKKVIISGDAGREHSATLSLDGLSTVADVREALTELVAEVLDDDALLTEDLIVEVTDGLGRRRTMLDDMSLSAVLRAASLRTRRRASGATSERAVGEQRL